MGRKHRHLASMKHQVPALWVYCVHVIQSGQYTELWRFTWDSKWEFVLHACVNLRYFPRGFPYPYCITPPICFFHLPVPSSLLSVISFLHSRWMDSTWLKAWLQQQGHLKSHIRVCWHVGKEDSEEVWHAKWLIEGVFIHLVHDLNVCMFFFLNKLYLYNIFSNI